MRLACLFFLVAFAAVSAEPTLPIRLCFTYEVTTVGNPATAATSDCTSLEISGSDLQGALERNWSWIRSADDRAGALWDSLRRLGRDHSDTLTVVLRGAALTTSSTGPARVTTYPAEGARSIRYRRVRVWLKDGTFGFDYHRQGGPGPERLFDLGRTIGRR